MRGWTLCGAALSASIVAAISFILILIGFLAIYTGQLPIENHQRSLMQGIQVMLYLLPFLIAWAWCCYLVIFALYQPPVRVWQMKQILWVVSLVFVAWWALLCIVIIWDYSLSNMWYVFKLTILSYGLFLFPIVAGLVCGNIFYLKLHDLRQGYSASKSSIWQKSIL